MPGLLYGPTGKTLPTPHFGVFKRARIRGESMEIG